jgi:hypothetical protein
VRIVATRKQDARTMQPIWVSITLTMRFLIKILNHEVSSSADLLQGCVRGVTGRVQS